MEIKKSCPGEWEGIYQFSGPGLFRDVAEEAGSLPVLGLVALPPVQPRIMECKARGLLKEAEEPRSRSSRRCFRSKSNDRVK